jgi:hypothetical protein
MVFSPDGVINIFTLYNLGNDKCAYYDDLILRIFFKIPFCKVAKGHFLLIFD